MKQNSRGIIHLALLILVPLVLIVIFFVPIPYFIPGDKVHCLLAENCPDPGWNLGPSLFERIKNRPTTGSPFEESYISTPTVKPPGTSPSADPTVNWRIYTNQTHNYMLKIPPNWKAEENSLFGNVSQVVLKTPPSESNPVPFTNITITKTDKEKFELLYTPEQFEEWINNESPSEEKENLYKIGNVYVDNKEAVQFVNKGLKNSPAESLYTFTTWLRIDNMNFYITARGEENSVENIIPIYNQILSTFQFND